jgi:hypothetical protein
MARRQRRTDDLPPPAPEDAESQSWAGRDILIIAVLVIIGGGVIAVTALGLPLALIGGKAALLIPLIILGLIIFMRKPKRR